MPFEVRIDDITPQNAEVRLNWSISNEEIATVCDGIIEPHSYGETTLTLRDQNSGLIEYADIYVIPPITDVYLSYEGETDELIPYEINSVVAHITAGLEEYDTAEENGLVEFRSSDEGVLTVSQRGYIFAKSPGSAVVTARTRNGMESSIEVVVRSAKMLRIPSSVKRIEEGAFNKTNAEIYILPESLEFVSDTAFEGIESARFIVIPRKTNKEIIKKLRSFSVRVVDEDGWDTDWVE